MLLKINSVPELLWALVTSFAGVFGFAAAASGLSLLTPTIWGDILRIALMGVAVLLQVFVKGAQAIPAGDS